MTTDRDAIVEALLAYFGAMDTRVEVDTRLIERDVIDSLGVLDLVEFIEEEFGVALDQSFLVVENFETVGRVADTVMTASAE